MNLRDGLDWKAQSAAQALLKGSGAGEKFAILATKTLGVLQEAGIYSVILFLHTRRKDEQDTALKIMGALDQQAVGLAPSTIVLRDFSSRATYYTETICTDLHFTLMTKALWEQTLIYTRYGAKASKSQE